MVGRRSGLFWDMGCRWLVACGERNSIIGQGKSCCSKVWRPCSSRTWSDGASPCSPTHDASGRDNITISIKVYLGYVAKRRAECTNFVRVSSGTTPNQMPLSNKGSRREPSQGSQLRQRDIFPSLNERDSHALWTLYSPVVTIYTTSLTFTHSAFSPHSVFMCFVWIWEQTAIISLYNINWLVCINEI